jgi:peptide deformylase
MNLQLLKENDPVLREKCTPWDFEKDGDATEVIKELSRVMMENNGIGLAAPQCGLMKRIFVMGNENRLFACINPEILEGNGDSVMDLEGCLSFPDLWLHVKRYETVKVKYYNVVGGEIITDFTGLIARVFQHELDHLDGVCFDTRVGKVSLDLAKNRRKKRLRKSFN